MECLFRAGSLRRVANLERRVYFIDVVALHNNLEVVAGRDSRRVTASRWEPLPRILLVTRPADICSRACFFCPHAAAASAALTGLNAFKISTRPIILASRG